MRRPVPPGESAHHILTQEAVPGEAEEDSRVDQRRDDPLHHVVGLHRAGEQADILRKAGDSWLIARRELILEQNVLLAKNLSILF